MTARTDSVFDLEWQRLRSCADNFTNGEILDRWCTLGDILRESNPDAYRLAFVLMLRYITNPPEHARVATPENWERIARLMLSYDDNHRRQLAAHSIALHLELVPPPGP